MGVYNLSPEIVFLDVNILMELFFSRPKRDKISQEVASISSGISLVTSLLAVDIFFYYVEKGKFDKSMAHKFLSRYSFLDINQADYEWARDNDTGDFEDALQVACALRHGCTLFMTLDASLASSHKKHISMKLIG